MALEDGLEVQVDGRQALRQRMWGGARGWAADGGGRSAKLAPEDVGQEEADGLQGAGGRWRCGAG